MLKEFFAFLSWLDTEPKYRWEKPKGLDKINRSPITLPEDNNHKTAFQTVTKETYTPEQLVIIAKHADAFDKALIGVCVNCAFGASEIGQLPTPVTHCSLPIHMPTNWQLLRPPPIVGSSAIARRRKFMANIFCGRKLQGLWLRILMAGRFCP